MSGGYQVDLEYLQDAVLKLKRMAAGLDVPHQHATYNTNIAPEDVGGPKFIEASTLHSAHANMASQLQEMITTLQSMITDFSDKTHQVSINYGDTEHATKSSLS